VWALGVVIAPVVIAPVVIVADGASAARRAAANAAPVTVMTIGDFGAQRVWSGAVQARLSRVSARGLRDGAGNRHRVDVVVCDTKLDAARAEACAQQAVARRVAAVIGMSTVDSYRVWPILEAAGIPVIGPRVNSEADVSSPVSFPLTAGIVGTLTAMPQLLAKEGARTIGVLVTDFGDATNSVVSLVADGLRMTTAAGGPVVRVPIGVSDLTEYVQQATAGSVDGLVVFVATENRAAAFEALRAAHFQGKVVTQASLVQPLLSRDDMSLDGTLLVGEFPPFETRLSGMREFQNDLLDRDVGLAFEKDEGALNFWLAARVFQRVAAQVPHIDAASLLQALGNIQRLDTGGLTPPFTASTSSTAYPRLFNPTVTFQRVEGGNVQWIGKGFFDPLAGRLR
jgi:branched-chain amino acid transport system substrate-binding protein